MQKLQPNLLENHTFSHFPPDYAFSSRSLQFFFPFLFLHELKSDRGEVRKQGHQWTKIVSIIIPSAAKALYIFWCMLIEAVMLL